MLHFFCFVEKDEWLAEKDKALLQSLMLCTACLWVCNVHQQQISLLNFYQFLHKEFPLSLISRQKAKKDAKTRIQDSNVCLAFGVWSRAAKVTPFNVFWLPPLSTLDNNNFSISGKREDGKINSRRRSTTILALLHIIFSTRVSVET